MVENHRRGAHPFNLLRSQEANLSTYRLYSWRAFVIVQECVSLLQVATEIGFGPQYSQWQWQWFWIRMCQISLQILKSCLVRQAKHHVKIMISYTEANTWRKLVGNMSFTVGPRTWTVIYVKLHSVCWNRFFFFYVFFCGKVAACIFEANIKRFLHRWTLAWKPRRALRIAMPRWGCFLRVVRSGMLQKISIQCGGLCPPKTLGIHGFTTTKHECSKWEIQNDNDFLFMLSISVTHVAKHKKKHQKTIASNAKLLCIVMKSQGESSGAEVRKTHWAGRCHW